MFKKLVRHITEGNTYQGLEIFDFSGKETFSLLKLRQKKGELDLLDSLTCEKLDELLPRIDKKAPLFVTFNSAKVLKKNVQSEAKNNPELLLVNAFPNLELDNFYYQVAQAGANAIVCISKKEHIDWYLEQLQKMGINPFQISLGLSEMDALSGHVDGTLIGSNFEVYFENSSLIGFNPSINPDSKNTTIGGLPLEREHILPFSQLLGYLSAKPKISNLSSVNSEHANNFKNLRIFDFGIKTTLGFFLVLLLGNFFAFNHYHTENQQLESNLANGSLQDSSIKQLSQRVSAKEERFNMLTKSKNSKTSLYFDKLGMGIPPSIYLGDMQIQPLLFPIRKDKPIELQEQALQVSGVTNDKNAFTVWSDNLETQDWVHRVEIMDYEYISSSSANFTLNLVLNDAQ